MIDKIAQEAYAAGFQQKAAQLGLTSADLEKTAGGRLANFGKGMKDVLNVITGKGDAGIGRMQALKQLGRARQMSLVPGGGGSRLIQDVAASQRAGQIGGLGLGALGLGAAGTGIAYGAGAFDDPSTMEQAQQWIAENPGLAAASGVGAAGLGALAANQAGLI